MKEYADFVSKYAGRTMCESMGGRVQMFKDEPLKLNRYSEPVIVDLYWTPSILGWQNEKQRRQFYKDAKAVGVRRVPNKKNEWYKLTTRTPCMCRGK